MSREKAAGNLHVVTTEPSNHRVRVAHKKLDRTYQYDHVFGPFASQEEVFISTVQPIVKEMLQVPSTLAHSKPGFTSETQAKYLVEDVLGLDP